MKNKTLIQIIIIVILIIILGVLLKFTIDTINENKSLQKPDGTMNSPSGSMPDQMGGNSSSITYSSVEEITVDTSINNGEYSSQKEDENAFLVNGDIDVEISNIEVTKTGDSDGGDNTSFYGINSAILAKSGANLKLKNITVTTNRGWSKWSIFLWWICYYK